MTSIRTLQKIAFLNLWAGQTREMNDGQGVSTCQTLGDEHYCFFDVRNKTYCQYDYRHVNGELFTCVKPTLDDCRIARDEWVANNNNKA